MLVLCPDFPKAGIVRQNLKDTTKEAQQYANGTRFSDGSYRVGKKIRPGTYVVRRVDEGCYWERLNRNGDIIDNNFVAGSSRVQVTIRSSDYTSHSEGCGSWVRA